MTIDFGRTRSADARIAAMLERAMSRSAAEPLPSRGHPLPWRGLDEDTT